MWNVQGFEKNYIICRNNIKLSQYIIRILIGIINKKNFFSQIQKNIFES